MRTSDATKQASQADELARPGLPAATRAALPIRRTARTKGFVKPTAARRISFEDSLIFEQLHEQAYRELGFTLVDVPAGPLADRTALILQAIFQRQAG